MKRIGILGGTFNPIHIGHLTIAQMVCEQLKLDKVIFVPSYLPPHKSGRNVVSAKDRYAMVQLAIRGNRCFDISDFEIKKKGKSYSIETVTYFRDRLWPGAKVFFIIGGDLLPQLHTWRQIDDLVKIVSFVVVERPGYDVKVSELTVKFVEAPVPQTSSTYVRRRLASGKTVKYLIPDNVLRYIEKNKLYQK